jgi:hypothetical protein
MLYVSHIEQSNDKKLKNLVFWNFLKFSKKNGLLWPFLTKMNIPQPIYAS